MRLDVLGALLVGAAAPLGALAYAARWRTGLLAARAAQLAQAEAIRKRSSPAPRRSRRKAAASPPMPHQSLDWLGRSLADPNTLELGQPGIAPGIPGPGVVAPARVCRVCGHRNRIGAYRCANCSARLRE